MRVCAAERHQCAHDTWHGERRAAADALAERQRIITCNVRMQRATSGATLDCNIRCNVGAARDCEGVSAFVNVCVRSRWRAIRRAVSAVSTEITGERPRAAANKQTKQPIGSGSSRQNNKHVTASLELASHVLPETHTHTHTHRNTHTHTHTPARTLAQRKRGRKTPTPSRWRCGSDRQYPGVRPELREYPLRVPHSSTPSSTPSSTHWSTPFEYPFKYPIRVPASSTHWSTHWSTPMSTPCEYPLRVPL